MPIDHTCIFVPLDKFQACLSVYTAALKPLGYEARHQFGETIVGMGCDDHPISNYKTADFWVMGAKTAPEMGAHLAFRTKDRAAVDAFHAAAIKAGGSDNGAPGLRSYHPNYYAAFFKDAAGNNIEAVCHDAAE